MKVEVKEVGLDENNNPVLSFTYKNESYIGIRNTYSLILK